MLKIKLLSATLVFFVLLLFSGNRCNAQCTIEIFASSESITCGDSVLLSAFGHTGNFVLNNDFNDGTPGTGWSATASAMFDNPCGQHPGGDTYLWFGDSTPHPRSLTTLPMDLQLGGTICFDMKFATQGQPAPCEGPDLPDEGVALQYSLDGGNTWETIHYFNPNGGYDPVLTTWNDYCFSIPQSAMMPNTKIRWKQIATSGAGFDHWGLNNVQIILIDPDYNYIWEHDGFVGQFNDPVFPESDTTFTVYLTNGINDTCSASVFIEVSPPEFMTHVESVDSFVCPGDCVELNAQADILVNPASQPTYTNNFSQAIVALLGQTVAETVPMNVEGLNMHTIEPGSIESVCFYLQNTNNVTVSLVCPDGNELLLTESSVAGGSFGDSTGNVACFTMDATQTIANSSPHYIGDFLPDNNGSLDDLTGCSAEGLWQLKVESSAAFGIHMLNSWSITFNDPDLIIPAQFHWEPESEVSDPQSLNPTVCPNQSTTYTLWVYDAHACDTTQVEFTVGIDPSCCDIEINQITTVQPDCEIPFGSIQISTQNGEGLIEYSIDNGANFQTDNVFSGLPPGTYEVLARDAENCFTPVETIVLESPEFPVLDVVDSSNLTCNEQNGSILLSASGGTGSLEYSIDNGVNFQSQSDFTNLSAGVYEAVAIDEDGCTSDTIIIELIDLGNPELQEVDVVQPSCGEADGQIIVEATGGTEPFTFLWSNNQAGSTIMDLSGGVYTVTVTDDNSCTDTLSITLFDLNTAEINDDNIVIENTPCGVEEGSITGLNVTGNDPFNFVWLDDNNQIVQQSTVNADVFDLVPGNYVLQVVDADSCVSSYGPVEIIEIGQPEADDTQLNITEAQCGLSDGSITGITVTGNEPFNFEWFDQDLNLIFSNDSTTDLTNQDAGDYVLVITDAGGCILEMGPYTIPEGSLPEIIDFTVINPQSCAVPDGEISVTVSGGTGNYTYIWSHDANLNSAEATGLNSGLYNLTVEDIGGEQCAVVEEFELTTPEDVVAEVIATDVSCFGETDGTALVNIIEGEPPFSYNWQNGDTTELVSNLSPGTYQVEVTDANQCVSSVSFTINEPDSLFFYESNFN